jgi:hypothetical protein
MDCDPVKIRQKDGTVVNIRMDRVTPERIRRLDVSSADKVALLVRVARRELRKLQRAVESEE